MTEKTSDKSDVTDKKNAQAAIPIITPIVLQNKQPSQEDVRKAPMWLLTFADVTALMLTFFVLMYSMSSTDIDKWEEMTAALNSGFDKFKSLEFKAGEQDTIDIDKLQLRRALPLDYLQFVIAELAKTNDSLSGMVLFLQKDRLIISLPQNLLFESGQADVNSEGQRALFVIGGKLSNIRNRIEVVGHADPDPISANNERFSSNRELSLARALNVAAVLDKVGYDRSVTARGMGVARYDELSEAMPEDQRLGLSRRVDIVILKGSGNALFSDMQIAP